MGVPTHRLITIALYALLLTILPIRTSKSETEPVTGIQDNTPRVHALVGARIVVRPGKVLDRGTLVIRDGVIESVGSKVTPPADARVWDCEGLTLYPGLIDAFTHVGFSSERREGRGDRSRRSDPEGSSASNETEAGARHWNSKVHPERSAAELYRPSDKELETMRELGFTAALIVPSQGIFRGSSAVVSLRDGDASDVVLREDVAQHVALERGSWRDRTYPNSLMGAIALIRQTFLDASWYYNAHQIYGAKPDGLERPEVNLALEALVGAAHGRVPVVFESSDELNFLRAAKIAKEFGLNSWIRGSGHEYRRLEQVKQTGSTVILPLDFPQAPAVEDPEEAIGVNLDVLQHWDLAPENPARLKKAGIRFVLTTDLLKSKSDFPKRLRKAIERGLNEGDALSALTAGPASLLGVDDRLGTLERGKLAHVLVVEGKLFEEDATLREVWVDGVRFEIEKKPEADPSGTWAISLGLPQAAQTEWTFEISGKPGKLTGKLTRGETEIKTEKLALEGKRLLVLIPGKDMGLEGVLRMVGTVEPERLRGNGELADGSAFAWTAEPKAPEEKAESEEEIPGKDGEASKVADSRATPLIYPPGAYGRGAAPDRPAHILIRNATLWTCTEKGKLEGADMLISNGKIAAIGPELEGPGDAVVIEAGGKHVTPGLIDAHSHSGISGGVNEGTQAVTAEVRIADVVNGDHISLYRELAGGLTAINQLHGSANPIGGQASVLKLRWGAPPDELAVEDAIPGIKFALGENVKQSNWGDDFTTRYPQTRMGVEQIIRDRFNAALDYEREWESYRRGSQGKIPPRRDLELEALLEILRGERLIHCHSYRQDEILMLVRIAEDYGFTIGAFQHVLEGYKVAEAIGAHGAGASTFTDWWAYKFEVYDAIPFNGTLMHDAGVVVSFNSDSSELARRMNTEAAKAVKYGGMSEEDALLLVTLNPAKQLHIDHRTGSLEAGKDADFVIWNGSPLSTYTICEQTWVDGRKYFDRQRDLEARRWVAAERARLIQKVLASDDKGEKGSGWDRRSDTEYSCTEGGGAE